MDLTRLGDPDITIGALKILVHGRQFEDSQDFWDGNWLRITAHCAAGGGSARAHGSILHPSELVHFLAGCERLHETLAGKAELPCMESNLGVDLSVSSPRGSIEAEIRRTLDHLLEEHTFRFSIDQSYLPGIIGGLRRVVATYPVRGKPE